MSTATAKLHLACSAGNLDEAAGALASGAKVNAYSPDGLCAIHLAAAAGSAALVRQLAATAGPGLNIDRGREADGSTALHGTAEDGAGLDVAQALLEGGANANAKNLDGCTPLHSAAHMGARQYVQLLLQHGAKADQSNFAGQTPLLMAAEACGTQWVDRECDYPGSMQALLEAGANPNAADACGDAPLHVALRARAAPVVAVLCAGGADVNIRAGRLSGCCTPLHICAGLNDVASLHLLLAAGADVGAAESEGGMLPLHVAAQAGHAEAVEVLLAAGVRCKAQPDSPCQTGMTAVHLAAQEGHPKVLARLLTPKASPDPDSLEGIKHTTVDATAGAGPLPSPLHLACYGGHLPAAQALVQHGQDVCAVDPQGDTALHVACRAGAESVIEWLLSLPQGQRLAMMRNVQGKLPHEGKATPAHG